MTSGRLLTQIGVYFATLSLMAIGGANVVIPDMHRHFVEVQGWINEREFISLLALSQVAPGPNVLIVSLLGWKVAGLGGALMATAGMCVPSSLLTFFFMRFWRRYQQARWQVVIQAGLAPVTIGLILASGYVLVRSADKNWMAYSITIATIILVLKTKINPLWILAIASLMGYMGWV